MTADETIPSLVEWAGGPPALRRMIDAFYDRVERDDLLAPMFPGGVSEHHRAHVADWWTEVFGGPATYTEQHGGYENMVAHHVDLAITPAQRHRFVALMSLAADDAALPDDPEFRAAVLGYVEWGHPHRDDELAAWRGHRGSRARAALGLGRRAALDRLSRPLRR